MSYVIKLAGRGILKELLVTGLAYLFSPMVTIAEFKGIYDDGIHYLPESDNFDEDFASFLEGGLNEVKNKVENSPGSRVAGNDKNSFSKTFTKWYGFPLREEDTYPRMFASIIERTAELLKSGKLSAKDSLANVSVSKKGEFIFGLPYKDELAITPSIIKQMEFYEQSTTFLKPTKGPKSMAKLDPVWFSLLSLGFLICYAGFYGGSYYLLTKPDLEVYIGDRKQVQLFLGTILRVSATNIRHGINLISEECYELDLSLQLAKELEREILNLRWPLMLYKENIVGKAYTAEKVTMLDLSDLTKFAARYIEEVKSRISKRPIEVKWGDEHISPLEALVKAAQIELSKQQEGDNELLLYIMVKDLYRSISTGREELMLDTLQRILRKAAQLKVSKEGEQLNWLLDPYSKREHMECIVNALREAT